MTEQHTVKSESSLRLLGRALILNGCRLFVSLFVVLTCQITLAQTELPTSGQSIGDMSAFDQAMNRILVENEIPGGSLAVAYKGQMLLVKAYGYSSKGLFGASKPATTEMVWRLASVTKTITSIAILQLVDQGLMTLDDPFMTYLKGTDSPTKLSDERMGKVTIRMLLQHRSGLLSSDNDPMTRPSPPCPNRTGRWLEFHTLVDDPGTKYSYSNIGYCLLGIVIKNVSGMSYEEYVKQMLSKLGITSVRLGASNISGPDEVNYYQAPGESRGPYNYFDIESLGATGGLVAKPQDLVKFIDNIFGTENSLIKNINVYSEIVKPPVAPTDRRFYGLGFNVLLLNQNMHNIFHGGSLIGTSTWIAKYSDGWTVAAAFNKRRLDYEALTISIDTNLSKARSLAKLPDASRTLAPY